MGAPEFAHSDKLRRVFTALENRAYLGELVGAVAESGVVKVYIGQENEPPDMQEVALILAPYGRAATAPSASSASSGPRASPIPRPSGPFVSSPGS